MGIVYCDRTSNPWTMCCTRLFAPLTTLSSGLTYLSFPSNNEICHCDHRLPCRTEAPSEKWLTRDFSAGQHYFRYPYGYRQWWYGTKYFLYHIMHTLNWTTLAWIFRTRRLAMFIEYHLFYWLNSTSLIVTEPSDVWDAPDSCRIHHSVLIDMTSSFSSLSTEID